jgi:radical SAM protein with 4Fe4S-binding SPASM domain
MDHKHSIGIKKGDFLQNRRIRFGTLCQAPFTTMNFSQQGVIHACCANRTYELGRVPDNTLDEIWNGEKVKKLRQEMDNFSFNLKCEQCELMLDSANYKSLKISHYDTEESIRPGNEQSYRNLKYPYRLDFELNNTCNLECIMCNGNYSSSIRKNREGRELYQSPYDSDSFFEQLKPFLLNAKRIGFFGGEPFLVSVYYKIFDFLLEHNLTPLCYIQTNGTIYSEKIKTYLEKLNINLSVSLDAATKDVYEKIRKNAIFERTVSNISKFKDILQKKGAVFYISPVIFTENLFDIKNILDLANKFNAPLYFHHLEYPQLLCLKYENKEILKSALDFYYSLNPIDFKYPDNSSKIVSSNINAFFDELNYIKYCYTNHDKTNSITIDKFLEICEQRHPAKLKILKEKIKEKDLSEKKTLKLLVSKYEHTISEIDKLSEDEFSISVDKFLIESKFYLSK